MPHPVRPPFAITLAATLLTLAGAGASRAVAGCGDYVVYASPAAADRHPLPADQTPGKCHGPLCSAAPPLPAAPTLPTKTRAPNDDRAVEATRPVAVETSHPFPFDPSGERPVRRPSDIFHPPR
jgi:hypothetical protein